MPLANLAALPSFAPPTRSVRLTAPVWGVHPPDTPLTRATTPPPELLGGYRGHPPMNSQPHTQDRARRSFRVPSDSYHAPRPSSVCGPGPTNDATGQPSLPEQPKAERRVIRGWPLRWGVGGTPTAKHQVRARAYTQD